MHIEYLNHLSTVSVYLRSPMVVGVTGLPDNIPFQQKLDRLRKINLNEISSLCFPVFIKIDVNSSSNSLAVTESIKRKAI